MKYFKTTFFFLFLTSLISCGGKNEFEESNKKTKPTKTPNTSSNILNTGSEKDTISINPTTKTSLKSKDASCSMKNSSNNNIDKKNYPTIITPVAKKVNTVINSPLRNLLNSGQIGKSYTKKELIEEYKFPQEAVDLVKHITYVGENKLYFKWGSTWMVEKISDAKFKNDTMIITFKHNKTHISGGAIGIKYNRRIYTDLILNNGAAYIPSVKGYHWDIGK